MLEFLVAEVAEGCCVEYLRTRGDEQNSLSTVLLDMIVILAVSNLLYRGVGTSLDNDFILRVIQKVKHVSRRL